MACYEKFQVQSSKFKVRGAIQPQARAWKPIAGGQAPGTGTRSDHADCQPLTVGGAVAAQDAALVIDGRLAANH